MKIEMLRISLLVAFFTENELLKLVSHEYFKNAANQYLVKELLDLNAANKI